MDDDESDEDEMSRYNLEVAEDFEEFGYEQVIDSNVDTFTNSNSDSVQINPGRNFSNVLQNLNWRFLRRLSLHGNALSEDDMELINDNIWHLQSLE